LAITIGAAAERPVVKFWHTQTLPGGQGTCGVCFTFDGTALTQELQDAAVTVRVMQEDGQDLGTSTFTLRRPLGGAMVNRFADGMLQLAKWPLGDDGMPSPLCSEMTQLIVEKLTGTLAGQPVDLVSTGQLEYIEPPRARVKVKSP
jgi:hypothetical protein